MEPNPFGWSLIVKPEFIEYSRSMALWIAKPDKDIELIKKQYEVYVPAGEMISHEITRKSLEANYNVSDINDSFFKQFFSSNTFLNYVLVYDLILDYDTSKFRQILKFVLNNTPLDLEEQERDKLKKLIINREVNYKNLQNNKKFIPLNRLVDILEFHNREELLEWLKVRKIKHKIRKYDLYFY